ncbi:hypothetical protein DNFV4_01470 [Nitrospira tepida]|uniref:DUF5666 domain-containing protein n=1 Tax=Nitrospira tepida TaxID=2973512 RepID=A0AA86MXV9_9BACT|nr:hypothetical protein [Nitrospira tepida]CAI4031038.1 hypothetical protein DNFV4_01470 [Nitrospira tepida]
MTFTKSMIAVALIAGFSLATHAEAAEKKRQQKFDSKPGPAHRMVQGKLTKVEGNIYVVEDYEGNEVQMVVSKDTKQLRGAKKPGDTVRAEITAGHHANSIQ